MTTSFDPIPPSAPPPIPPRTWRTLRRSRSDRIGAGVAGGLGTYFDVDPVLFRVLFATSAFFGGIGVLAYVLAWVAVPEEGTSNAAVDGWIRSLRERRVPIWVALAAIGLVLWLLSFSWWAPGPFFPAVIAALVVVAVSARRTAGRSRRAAAQAGPTMGQPPTAQFGPGGHQFDAATQPMTDPWSDATAAYAAAPVEETATSGRPGWVGEARQWAGEMADASRERRRRTFPVRVATLGVLVVVLGILGAVDAGSHNVPLPALLWPTFGILLAGLLIGAAARRTPWSFVPLIGIALVGILGFGATGARLSDGFGEHDWVPTTAQDATYRLAFGQGILDLTRLPINDIPATMTVVMASGHAEVVVPPTANVRIVANVHIGDVEVDGQGLSDGAHHSGGLNLQRTIEPPVGANGAMVTVVVKLADGLVSVYHRS